MIARVPSASRRHIHGSIRGRSRAHSLASLLAIAVMTAASPALADTYLLRPARVFDGVNPQPHEGWSVLVEGDKIAAAGPNLSVPAGARVIELPGETLTPGLIEGHSHLFLHPYNEAKWDDQVLHEPLALRTARAVVQAERTLDAGFTTERDLGTEGAGYADVGIKQAINQGIIPGPRMLVATKANVARGAYGPKGFEPGVHVPQGAEEVSGADEMTKAARDQISAGADVIKMYADYHYMPGEPSRPTLTEAEMAAGVAVAHDAGRIAAAHATTAEGMRRAVLAGVDTIEHGYGGTPEVFKMMHDRGTGYCPTLGASEAYARYFAGWNGQEPAPADVQNDRRALQMAIKAGVRSHEKKNYRTARGIAAHRLGSFLGSSLHTMGGRTTLQRHDGSILVPSNSGGPAARRPLLVGQTREVLRPLRQQRKAGNSQRRCRSRPGAR